MKIYSCETHIDQAIDVFVAEQEKFPIMEKCTGKRKVIHKLYLL